MRHNRSVRHSRRRSTSVNQSPWEHIRVEQNRSALESVDQTVPELVRIGVVLIVDQPARLDQSRSARQNSSALISRTYMACRIGQSDRVGRSPSNRIVRVHQSPIGRQDRFVSISSIKFDHGRQSEPAGHSAIQSFSHSVIPAIQSFSHSESCSDFVIRASASFNQADGPGRLGLGGQSDRLYVVIAHDRPQFVRQLDSLGR